MKLNCSIIMSFQLMFQLMNIVFLFVSILKDIYECMNSFYEENFNKDYEAHLV